MSFFSQLLTLNRRGNSMKYVSIIMKENILNCVRAIGYLISPKTRFFNGDLILGQVQCHNKIDLNIKVIYR